MFAHGSAPRGACLGSTESRFAIRSATILHTYIKRRDVPYETTKTLLFVWYVSAIGKQMQSSARASPNFRVGLARHTPQDPSVKHWQAPAHMTRLRRNCSESTHRASRPRREHSKGTHRALRPRQEHFKSTHRASRPTREHSKSTHRASRPRQEHFKSTHRAPKRSR